MVGADDCHASAYEQQCEYEEDDEVDALLLEVVCRLVYPSAEGGELLYLSVYLVVLYQQHLGVVVVDECGGEPCVLVVRLATQYGHSQLQHFVAPCGVNKGGVQHALLHESHTAVWQGVHAAELYLVQRQSVFADGFACPHRHAVVMGEDAVEVRTVGRGEQRVHHVVGVLLRPVRVQLLYNGEVGISADDAVEAGSAFYGRRGVRLSAQFYDAQWCSGSLRGKISRHGGAYLPVVCADVCGEFCRLRPTVKEYDGNACVVGAVDGR